jgi:hypothetical protein
VEILLLTKVELSDLCIVNSLSHQDNSGSRVDVPRLEYESTLKIGRGMV